MTDDETAIRALVATWMQASQDGDIDTVLDLMADDVVFMTPGREPFGKEEFRAGSESMKGMTMQGRAEIRELQVLGDWAFIRNHIEITMTPARMIPKSGTRFLDKIMRYLKIPARSDAKPVSTFADRAGGSQVQRAGYTLTLLRKESDGHWRLARDANLLAPKT